MRTYQPGFYEAQHSATSSARRILPWLLDIVQPASIADIGCGIGGWLEVARMHGVADFMGVDGEHVPADLLLIPPTQFQRRDLTQPLSLGRSFDLALCLEVAEHLPPARAESLVADLAALAPVVVFSAAIPGQGGTFHTNEQWPDYWWSRFEAAGFHAIDAIRPRFWRDADIDWWYAQNTIIYARPDCVADIAQRCAVGVSTEAPLPLVHPRAWEAAQRRTTRMLIGELRRRLFGV